MKQLWTRAAVIALTAGTLGACETTASAPLYPTRDGQAAASTPRALTPNFPITQAPAIATAPQATASEASAPEAGEVIRPVPMTPEEAGSPVVQRKVLAAVTQSELPPPQVSAPAPVAARASAPVVTTSVTGPVVDVGGKPKVHVVKSGDVLDAIARDLGTTRADLAKDNDLEPPYRLKIGQELKGPATKGKAYVVQTGDTMFAIARRFNITAAALAEENDLKTSAGIRKGQKLRLPQGYKDKGPIKTTTPGVVATADEAAPATPATGAGKRPTRPAATEPVEAAPTSFSTTTTTSVNGAVVEVAGPRKIHKVKSGEAIDSIARDLGTTRKELAADNDLKAPYLIRPGQKLKGPATTAKAYVAQSGDTLAEIAKRFSVSVKALAAENNLRSTAAVKKGQKIRLPNGYKDKGPIRTTVTRPVASATSPAQAPAPVPTVSTPSAPIPYAPSPSASRPSAPVAAMPVSPPPAPSRPIIESSAAPTEAEIIASGKGRFSWPLRGEILSDFGVKGTGQRNDGVNIRAPQGAPVVAAADGEIAYAGNQVPTFGNLVLVKHADGWVTAYAHLGSTSVKMRQQVSKGDQLGTVGATGGVNEPQLHFEMRYAPTVKDKARPVDPALVLPK